MKNIRPIAIYLPQFHPIPENDEWWGKGFTEWTNVAKAKPLFEGHYQPHLPTDLGFYDLRIPEVREEQAMLAKASGIYGFCYYHYWFNGRRILERPFNEVLQSGKPDFPFMLCWANENWTRVWDGGSKNILLEQQYSDIDDLNHIQSLIQTFKDPRYIKVDDKPVFIIYKSSEIPDVKRTISIWRTCAKEHGIKLYLCRMSSFGENGKSYLEDGFDAGIAFEPFSRNKYDYLNDLKGKKINNKLSFWYLKYKFSSKIQRAEMIKKLYESIDYNDYVDFIKNRNDKEYRCYPGITPMWDNSARRKSNYFMMRNSSPQKFEEWVKHEIDNFAPFSMNENFIFINAWNEWAEGNHLEPCLKWGTDYLEALKSAISIESKY